jgi:hypothetical protein
MEKFLTGFAGFSNALLGRCTGNTQSRAALLGAILLVVAFISSTLACISAHFIWGASLLNLLPLFAVWFIFIYLFDRGILQTQRSGWVIGIRVCMALLLALLHAYFIDLMVFGRDIDLALFDQNKSRTEKIETKFQPGIDAAQAQTNKLNTRGVQLRNTISQWRNDLKNEADGTGGSHKRGVANIYAEKYKLFMQDSISTANELTGIDQQVIQLNREKDSLSHVAQAAVDATPDLREQAGIAKRIETAHQIVFAKGNWSMQLFFGIMFLLAISIELLPAVLKYSIDLSELHQMESRQLNDSLQLFNHQSDTDLNLQLSRIATNQTQEMAKETSIHGQKMLEVRLEEVRHKHEKVKQEFEHYDKEYTVLLATVSEFKDELEANIKNSVTEVSNV